MVEAIIVESSSSPYPNPLGPVSQTESSKPMVFQSAGGSDVPSRYFQRSPQLIKVSQKLAQADRSFPEAKR